MFDVGLLWLVHNDKMVTRPSPHGRALRVQRDCEGWVDECAGQRDRLSPGSTDTAEVGSRESALATFFGLWTGSIASA